MRLPAALFDPWAWRTAWRDSRHHRGRLLLYVASMTVGVAALVAIGSFGDNMQAAVAAQARTLLGSDLSLRSRSPFDDETERLIADRLVGELGGEVARVVSFSSMAAFETDPARDAAPSSGSRLCRVRALDGGYPFHGELETEPPGAAAALQAGTGALVDATLMAQFGARVGDRVQVGANLYPIAGRLLGVPGETANAMLLGPRVYVPLQGLDPDLLARGSRVGYYAHLAFPEGVDAEAERVALRAFAREHDLRLETVATEQDDWSDALGNLHAFLALVSFVALLLGGLGVGASMHVYARSRMTDVATLRCVGASGPRAFAVCLVQAAALGALGATAGALVGLAVQQALPRVLSGLLPVDVEARAAPGALLFGAGVGFAVALLFALLPLLSIRKVPPLAALRADIVPRRDPWRWAVIGLLVAAVTGFAWNVTGEAEVGFGFAGGTLMAFGLLAALAKGLAALLRRVTPRRAPYVLRQGLANLHRPRNQTVLLMVALGLGTFLVLTLSLVQDSLLDQLRVTDADDRPNVVLFDIQTDQRDDVTRLVEEQGLPLMQQVPIVTMRIARLEGRDTAALRAEAYGESPADPEQDPERAGGDNDPEDGPGGRDGRQGDRDRRGRFGRTADGIPRWVLAREYRSTFRAALTDSETLLAGTFSGEPFVGPATPDNPVPVSAESGIAEDLGLQVGDTLTWDVSGVEIPSVVASIREVDWRRVQTNFFFVFPEGVLEAAPQFHVLVTRGEDPEEIAGLQRAMLAEHPNVSIIDVTQILQTADALLARVSFVIRFMALFSIAAGVLVLIAAVVVTRTQRIEESVLLRTLGATRAQVLAIMNVEYTALGLLAAATGALLALGAASLLAALVFETVFVPRLAPLLLVTAAVCGLTWLVGRLHSRGLHARPPLEILRAEG